MYESSFGLNDRPFAAAPAARRFFPATAIESARQTLSRCVERAEGAGLVIGPAGSGKSILCQALAEQFRSRFSIALLASGRLETPRSLLQAILFELGMPYRGLDEGELRLSLVDRLAARESAGDGLLLLIDEAHSLPLRLLEEIHQLTNLVRNGQPRVRVVLAGQAILEEHLGNAKLESLNQRIAARCYLQAFRQAETLAYIRHAISQAAGQSDELFAADALDAVHQATGGVPRLVNQLCDHALLLACAAGKKPLTAAGIEEAWADLQQLPTRWNAAPGVQTPAADIIEFGSLDEPAVAARITPESEPRLRTVADDDETLFIGEPIERIERIKDQLGAIDEQFQPAGTIGPEVELVFSTVEVNPFQEPFEEEELIVDRYFGKRTGPLAGAPVVRSAEGAELSSLLESNGRDLEPPVDTSASEEIAQLLPQLNALDPLASSPIIASIDQPLPPLEYELEAAVEPLDFEPSDDSDWENPPAVDLPGGMLPTARGWIHPSEDPVLPEEPVSAELENGLDYNLDVELEHSMLDMQPTIPLDRTAPAERPTPPVAVPMAVAMGKADVVEPPIESDSAAAGLNVNDLRPADQTVKRLDAGEGNDADLIIVEEDPIPRPPAPSAVRRQEYRQLFARLRKG